MINWVYGGENKDRLNYALTLCHMNRRHDPMLLNGDELKESLLPDETDESMFVKKVANLVLMLANQGYYIVVTTDKLSDEIKDILAALFAEVEIDYYFSDMEYIDV